MRIIFEIMLYISAFGLADLFIKSCKMSTNTSFIFFISLGIIGLLYTKKKYIVKYKNGEKEK